jgi:hypothetical protein
MEQKLDNILPYSLDKSKVGKEEAKVFLMIEELMGDHFTGNITLHISEGNIRKVETTSVERINS